MHHRSTSFQMVEEFLERTDIFLDVVLHHMAPLYGMCTGRCTAHLLLLFRPSTNGSGIQPDPWTVCGGVSIHGPRTAYKIRGSRRPSEKRLLASTEPTERQRDRAGAVNQEKLKQRMRGIPRQTSKLRVNASFDCPAGAGPFEIE